MAAKPSAQADTKYLIVMNDKGGVGKSFLIQGLSLELNTARVDHTVVEIEGDARLQKRLGDHVVWIPFGANPYANAVERARERAAFWDKVAERIRTMPRALIDISANATRDFWDWYETDGVGEAYLGKGGEFGVLVVTTGDENSLKLARAAVRNVSQFWPEAKLYLLISQHEGRLEATAKAIAGVLEPATAAGRDVPVFVLPACEAEGWAFISAQRIPLSELKTIPLDRLVAEAGLTVGSAARALGDTSRWLDRWRKPVQQVLQGVGWLPK